MAGHEGNEMLRHANWADAGTTTAMGNAERRLQIQMAHVSADVSGRAKANLGVHIRAIHVYLSTMGVDEFAYRANGSFKHAVRCEG